MQGVDEIATKVLCAWWSHVRGYEIVVTTLTARDSVCHCKIKFESCGAKVRVNDLSDQADSDTEDLVVDKACGCWCIRTQLSPVTLGSSFGKRVNNSSTRASARLLQSIKPFLIPRWEV